MLRIALLIAIAVPFFVVFAWVMRRLANRQSGLAFSLYQDAADQLGLKIVPPDPQAWRVIRGRIDGYDVSISRGLRGKTALIVASKRVPARVAFLGRNLKRLPDDPAAPLGFLKNLDAAALADLRALLAIGYTHFADGRLTWHYTGGDFAKELPRMVRIVKSLDTAVPLG
jgi:hypothetical protein